MNRPPNILWICSDQQRNDTLGCYGNTQTHTPNIDKLATNGVRFDHVYCQSPICTPSRSSFLTGRYPRTCRGRQNGADLPGSERLVTKLLAEAGYYCGLVGKLHLRACHADTCPDEEERLDDGYSEFNWSHSHADNWTSRKFHEWYEAKGYKHEKRLHPECEHVEIGPPAEFHQTTWCGELASDFISKNEASEQPWLYSVNFFDPHHSFNPPEAYLNRYLDRLDEIELPHYSPGELENKPSYQTIDHHGAYDGNFYSYASMTDKDHRFVKAAYWAMCDLIDDQVGRMMQALEASGQLDNTLVIFMSDHGEMMGDHGIYLKGPHFYEPAVKVPFIVSWPGRIAPGVSDALVELFDIAPTLMEAAGLKPYEGMQAKSLWPLLADGADRNVHRKDIYSEYYNAMVWYDPSPHVTMLRTETAKIAVDHTGNTGELYDLMSDPGEIKNLWDDPKHQNLKADLLLRLCHRMAWTVDPLPLRIGRH